MTGEELFDASNPINRASPVLTSGRSVSTSPHLRSIATIAPVTPPLPPPQNDVNRLLAPTAIRPALNLPGELRGPSSAMNRPTEDGNN